MPSIARAVEHRLASTFLHSYITFKEEEPFSMKDEDKISKGEFVKLLELAIFSGFIQGLSCFSPTKNIFGEQIKIKHALILWNNRSVLRGDMIGYLLSLEGFSNSSGKLIISSTAESFVNERLKSLSPSLKKMRNFSSLCPCLISGIGFFKYSENDNLTSKVLNVQRNVFGGHKE